MTDTYRSNTAMPSAKTADVNPVTDPGTQWGKDDANAVFAQITDMKAAVRGDVINVKNYGAKGDGVTTNVDGFAINAAISAAAGLVPGGAFGARVYLPKGVYIIDQKIRLSNGVGLAGDAANGTWIIPAPGYTDTAMIDNLNQDGTQEYAFLENLLIDGRRGSGAVCSVAVVNLVSIFIHSYVRNCVILNGSNVGLRLAAAGSPGGAGPVLVDNVWVDACAGHNVLLEEVASNNGAVAGFYLHNLTSEHQGSGSSALYLKGNGRSNGWLVNNFHTEMGNTTDQFTHAAVTGRVGITIDNVARVLINNAQIQCTTSTMTAGIIITNTTANVGIQIRAVSNTNVLNPILQDLKNGVTYGGVNVDIYETADITHDRFVVAPTGGTKSLSVRDSSGVERAYFDANGRLTSTASINGAGLDIMGDPTNNRPLTFVPVTGSPFSNVYGWYYPTGGGGVLRERSISGGNDVRQIGTDGSQFFYQALTCQSAVTCQSTLAVTGATTCSSTLKVVGNVGFNNVTPIAKPTLTGAKSSNAALASVISALVSYGLVIDSTTA